MYKNLTHAFVIGQNTKTKAEKLIWQLTTHVCTTNKRHPRSIDVNRRLLIFFKMFNVRSCIRLNVIQCNGMDFWRIMFDYNSIIILQWHWSTFSNFFSCFLWFDRQDPVNDFAIVISACLLCSCSSEFKAMNRCRMIDSIFILYSMKQCHDCSDFWMVHLGIMMSGFYQNRKSIQF